MQAVLDQNIIADALLRSHASEQPFGQKIGLMASVFGCWHKNMSRPFVEKKATYRTCLDCGARRAFDPENLRTAGPFYYPPTVT